LTIAPAVAGGLVAAAAVMAVLAFTTGDEGAERAAAPPTATPAAPSAAAGDGLAVWAEHGCGSCHALAAADSHGFIGPDLGASLAGMPPSYIKDGIVAPNKTAAAGYTAGGMPEDYGSRIAPEDLDRLVSFLRASAAR
jgi:hypothetical protein